MPTPTKTLREILDEARANALEHRRLNPRYNVRALIMDGFSVELCCTHDDEQPILNLCNAHYSRDCSAREE